jgi:hypothetical protein
MLFLTGCPILGEGTRANSLAHASLNYRKIVAPACTISHVDALKLVRERITGKSNVMRQKDEFI